MMLSCIFASPQFSFVLDLLEEDELEMVKKLVNEKLTLIEEGNEKL